MALVGGLVFGISACGNDSGSSESTGTTAGSDATTTVVAANTVTAADGWARKSPMGQSVGAAYMVLTGGATDDSLVAVTVPSTIAASVELHEVVMAGGNDDDMDGMMHMQEMPSIAVRAGATVVLEPGGLHLMLVGVTAPLTVGESFDATLEFASGEKLVVPVEVRGS